MSHPGSDIRNNVELAHYLHKFSGGAYHTYEFKDMLDILSDAIPTAVKNGHSVRISKIGRFYRIIKEERKVKSGLSGKIKLATMPKHAQIKFTLSVDLKRSFKAESIDWFR